MESRVFIVDIGDKFVSLEDGFPKGICVDLWRRIQNHLHLGEEKLVTWPQMFAELENQSVDMVISRCDENLLNRRGYLK